jgi:hypothetical protein
MSCLKIFILDKNDICCMNCNKTWNSEFINSVFTKTFRTTELLKHRENVLLAREKAMLGDSVLILEEQRRKSKINSEIYDKKLIAVNLNNEIEVLKIKLHEEYYNESKINSEINHKKKVLFELHREITLLRLSLLNINADPNAEPKKVQRAFYKPCPATGCTSLLSTRYRCTDTNCATFVCPECDCIKANFEDPDHECKQSDIDTVKLKFKECKRCPSCHTETYKVDGCDQVWCPPPCGASEGRNGTQWLFSSCKIDSSAPHAPLYYEYMRRINNDNIPRNPGDNPCNNLRIDNDYRIHQLIAYLGNLNVKAHIEFNEIFDIHRLSHHIRFHEIRKNNPNPMNLNAFVMNLDMRLLVLQNQITEAKWKCTLQRREKAATVKKTYSELLTLFADVTHDAFIKLLTKTPEENELYRKNLRLYKLRKVETMINEMHALRIYFNECSVDIHKKFNVGVFIICKKDWKREKYPGIANQLENM